MSQDPIRVLLVEDDRADYEVTRALAAKMDRPPVILEWVKGLTEALDALDDETIDLFLVDYVLDDGNGLELVREASRRGVRTPMIMLTGKGSLEVDVLAMEAGAADYLVKDRIDPPLLERSIRYALERRRSQDALRASEERLRTLFDRLPLGLYRITPEGDLLDANPALVSLLGHPNPETLQTVYSPQLFVRREDRTRFRERLESEVVVRGFETALRRRDGSLIHVRNSARIHRDEKGRAQYIEGALEDIDDVAWARRIRETEAHYRAVVAATRSGVLVVDLRGDVIEANTAAGDILGCPAEDLEDQSLTTLFVPEDRDGVRASLTEAYQRAGGRVEAERRLRSIDGSVLWARMSLAPVLDPAGEPFHILCMLEDVAEVADKRVDSLGAAG